MKRSEIRKDIAYLFIIIGIFLILFELSLLGYIIKVNFNEIVFPLVISTMIVFFPSSFVFLIRNPKKMGRIEKILGGMIERHFKTVSEKDYL